MLITAHEWQFLCGKYKETLTFFQAFVANIRLQNWNYTHLQSLRAKVPGTKSHKNVIIWTFWTHTLASQHILRDYNRQNNLYSYIQTGYYFCISFWPSKWFVLFLTVLSKIFLSPEFTHKSFLPKKRRTGDVKRLQ